MIYDARLCEGKSCRRISNCRCVEQFDIELLMIQLSNSRLATSWKFTTCEFTGCELAARLREACATLNENSQAQMQ
jgi:hypothetical protein